MSYKNDINYNLKHFEVVFASGKNQFVFFGNKLYKYKVNFTINDNINFLEKQIFIHSVSSEKTINFNIINLKIIS